MAAKPRTKARANTDTPGPAKPEQLKLAGFSSAQEGDIEIILERFGRIRDAAKLAIDRVKAKEQAEIADAEEEVFALMEKYGLKFLKCRGWVASITERKKLVVKGHPRVEEDAK